MRNSGKLALLGAGAVSLALTACMPEQVREMLPWKTYTVPSTSMEPTIPRGSYLMATTVSPSDLRRNDLVIAETNGEAWVRRIVGLPGERIALIGGEVIINRERATYRLAGTHFIEDAPPPKDHVVLRETFPGDAASHRILDHEDTQFDDFPEAVIPAGHYFLLGDNRDNSLDSRMPVVAGGMMSGMGMVSAERISRRVSLD